MRQIVRRQFLQDSAAMAAGLAALGAQDARAEDAPASRKAGPNDTVRVAVIGVSGRGKDHLRGFADQKDARVTTICDVDQNVLGKAKEQMVEQRRRPSPSSSQDLRKVLDDKDDRRRLDRHAQPLARPGRDLGLPGGQGRLRREAGQPQRLRRAADGRGRPQVRPDRPDRARRCRSHQGIQDAVEFLRAGKLGKVYMAKGLCYKPRGSIGHKADAPVPAGRRLRPLARPGPRAPVQPQPVPLRLALDLGHRQRRPRQPGHPPDGHRPLGPRQDRAAPSPCRLRAAGSATSTTARPRTPSSVAFELRRLPAPVRGPRPADQRRGRASASATSSTAPRASWRSPATRAGTPTSGPRWRRAPAARAAATTSPTSSRPCKPRDAKSLNGRHRGRPPLQRLCHLGNIAYRLGRKLHDQPVDRVVRQRLRGRRDADPRVPLAVRRPDAGLSSSAVGQARIRSFVWPIADRRDQAWPLEGGAPSSNTPIRRNFS